ncbi:23973_t:CDS:2 [Dentiscutata erythropus]|uniref:23973_t:CDS:1 n=1 Tax=Dentiscutata erythropus TaxID=1348616 RepID=A0A9N9CHM0_9GLOM|nr:23973_t:CDS:2 [Dentiscutata erythropus]
MYENFKNAVIGYCNELQFSLRSALDVPTCCNSIIPSEEDWKKAENVYKFLKLLYEGN